MSSFRCEIKTICDLTLPQRIVVNSKQRGGKNYCFKVRVAGEWSFRFLSLLRQWFSA